MQYIVDETGEVLEQIEEGKFATVLGPSDRIIRGATIEYLKGTVFINLKFYKVSISAMTKLSKYASEIWDLMPYVDYTTGILTYHNGKIIRPRGLSTILKRKRRSGSNIIKTLIDLDVIHKHREGRTFFFTFNPYIAMKGKRVTKDLYEEFKDTIYRERFLE